MKARTERRCTLESSAAGRVEMRLGSWGDDIGLLYLVLLNAAVLLASWRLARRRSADALDAAGDAFLLFYFVQYVSVCLTGVAGAMHALTIGLVALLMSALIALGSWRIRPREMDAQREVTTDSGGRDGASDETREARDARGAATAPTAASAASAATAATAGTVATVATAATAATHERRRQEKGGHAPRASSGSSSTSSPTTWRELWLRRRSRVVAAGAILFVAGYFGALVRHQRALPVISNDAITYHLPAAVQWLQTGRMGLYEAWYYNPANSYSPLGGSVFLTWLIAPMQNDSIARFVAIGPLLMLLIAMLNLGRRLGGIGGDRGGSGVAALMAAACVLARPFASQAILGKDDLFVAAFYVTLVDALTRERLSTRSGPFRVGIVLGLLLATKYTVLFSLPLLLLMVNRAWTLRRMLIAAGVALLIAGPWYLRNVRLTGNPLYPAEVTIGGVTVLSGMLQLARSALLATPRGAREVFVGGYYGLTTRVAVVLVLAWVVALIASVWMWIRRRSQRGERDGAGDLAQATPAPAAAAAVPWSSSSPSSSAATPSSSPSHWSAPHVAVTDPLVRTCIFGPVIGIAIFVFASPYGEMRFAYPSIALLFACIAIAMRPLPWSAKAMVAAGVMLLAAFTAFRQELSWVFVTNGAAVALPGMLIALAPRRIAKRTVLAAGGVAAVALGLYAYVFWQPYVRQTDADSTVAWSSQYGPVAEVWEFIRTSDAISAAPPPVPGAASSSAGGAGGAGGGVGSGPTIAYANTIFTYPLMGYRYEHRVVHVPTRRDLERFRDLPHLPRKVSGEELVTEIVAELRKNPDRDAWLRRLRESGAQFLVIAKYDPARPTEKIVAPEMLFAEQDPHRFVRVFDNDAGSVFRIVW